jgi:lambda repressor-like predicted transcriptional regulator
MHPADIAAALKKVGSSASAVGREIGVSQVSVSRVIAGQSRSERIEQRISEVTDIPPYRLWPQWYGAPEGVPKGFDPTRLNADLLESVERHWATALMARIPGLTAPFVVRARHRVAVYNACVDRGTIAIETGAGTADEVERFLAHWAENFEQTTGDKPTPEALRKWALSDAPSAAAGEPPRSSVHVTASDNSLASARDINIGSPRRRR